MPHTTNTLSTLPRIIHSPIYTLLHSLIYTPHSNFEGDNILRACTVKEQFTDTHYWCFKVLLVFSVYCSRHQTCTKRTNRHANLHWDTKILGADWPTPVTSCSDWHILRAVFNKKHNNTDTVIISEKRVADITVNANPLCKQRDEEQKQWPQIPWKTGGGHTHTQFTKWKWMSTHGYIDWAADNREVFSSLFWALWEFSVQHH